MIIRLIMWYLSKQYSKCNKPVFYIIGTGKDFPKALVYTEDNNIQNKLITRYISEQ